MQELYVPHMVTRQAATGSGQLPKFADTMYHDEEDDLWMIPTAEVPITNLHADEILDPGVLPLKYVAHSPSYRREKAAAGRDTRGIKRVHQFEKVEMFRFTEPQDSPTALDEMVTDAEELCSRLGLHHRVLLQCTGDLGFASVKTYDVELWAPGQQGLARGKLGLELHGLPGPTRKDTVPRRGGRSSATRAHPERLRAGHSPHAHRDHGKLPTGGRLDRRA